MPDTPQAFTTAATMGAVLQEVAHWLRTPLVTGESYRDEEGHRRVGLRVSEPGLGGRVVACTVLESHLTALAQRRIADTPLPKLLAYLDAADRKERYGRLYERAVREEFHDLMVSSFRAMAHREAAR